MENKSPGSGGGGGGGLSCISSSTQGLHLHQQGEKIVIGIGSASGGSPDSTTQQSGVGGGSIMSNKDNSSDHRGSSQSPAPGAGSISESNNSGSGASGGGGSGAPNMYSLKWNTQLLSLQRSLANLWDSGIGTDAVLLCQGTPLPVHKIVLTAASPYVASVVQTMAQASHMMPVIVVDIPAEAGKALLSFLYCGEAHVPVTIIPHLVLGAKFLGISGFGDPGVLESLTSIVPESVMTPDKTPPPSCDSPRQEPVLSESLRLPHFQLPIVPSHLMSSAVQINSSNSSNNNNFRDNSNNRKKSDVSNSSSDASSRDQPQHLLQFNHHHQLHQQIAMGKARIPYGSPYSTSSSSSGGEVINLTKNKTSGGSYSTFGAKNAGGKSPKSQTGGGGNGGGASTNSNRGFVGTTSILDNLLKNPRTQLEAAIAAAAAAAAASAHNAHNNNDASDNNDMVQYEAEGYADAQSSPHNLSAAHLIQQQRQQDQDRNYYYSPGSAGHPAFTSGGNDDDDNNMEMTMTEDNTPIPAHLLEPNVEYRVPQEYADRYGLLHNPLADLAKVAAASIQHQPATVGKRGSKKNQQQQQQQAADGNGVDDITSTGKQANSTPTPPKKAKKNPDSIICEICGKKFSNAYNLRVHMEGHSGQVFVCSVCSHASRSRDALRKHFAYRHRELWISGMSAFRKNVPGRKLSISKNNNNNNNNDAINNNMKVDTTDSAGGNTVVDANGNISIRGSDGTLSISEAK